MDGILAAARQTAAKLFGGKLLAAGRELTISGVAAGVGGTARTSASNWPCCAPASVVECGVCPSHLNGGCFPRIPSRLMAGRQSVAQVSNFSNWKNQAAFERAFAPPTQCFGATSRLEKDLQSSIGK